MGSASPASLLLGVPALQAFCWEAVVHFLQLGQRGGARLPAKYVLGCRCELGTYFFFLESSRTNACLSHPRESSLEAAPQKG
jgi:hypothetical protein